MSDIIPLWFFSAVLAGWNTLALSSTMAFARVLADVHDTIGDAGVMITAIAVLLVFQLPWLISHIRFVHKHIKGDSAAAVFKPTPFFKVLATQPTCKLGEITTICGYIELLAEWLEFLICFPFKLGFQGAI